MDGKFTLEITLGNDAMRRSVHVVNALLDLAAKLTASSLNHYGDEGKIMDSNGNTVGRWEYKREG